MPKKNGKEAFEEIKKIRPNIKVLFSSGYAADIIQKKGGIEEGINTVQKPISPRELIKKVRKILDR
jgi:DNA-binding response OmpR family regulator